MYYGLRDEGGALQDSQYTIQQLTSLAAGSSSCASSPMTFTGRRSSFPPSPFCVAKAGDRRSFFSGETKHWYEELSAKSTKTKARFRHRRRRLPHGRRHMDQPQSSSDDGTNRIPGKEERQGPVVRERERSGWTGRPSRTPTTCPRTPSG